MSDTITHADNTANDASAHDPVAADLLTRLKAVGALLEGHFQLSSGLHSNRYIQCAKLLAHPEHAEVACKALADKLRDLAPDVVVGPALGGIVVAYETARQLGVPNLFAERKEGEMTLRRGFEVTPGQRIVVIEDVVTTGKSVKEVISLLTGMGAEVVAIGSLVCRAERSPFEQRFETLLKVRVETWDPSDPPEWVKGSTPVKPGSRPGGVRMAGRQAMPVPKRNKIGPKRKKAGSALSKTKPARRKMGALQSMTGFGRAEVALGDIVAEVEVRSVNGRHFGLKCRLPSDLIRLEPKIEALVRRVVSRGRVEVHAHVRTGKPQRKLQIDRAILGAYKQALDRLGGGETSALLQLPGVVTLKEDVPSSRTLERLVMQAGKQALDDLAASRRAEGARLLAALRRELAVLRRHRDMVAKRAPKLVEQHHNQLRRRLSVLLDERLDSDDPVLRRELAALADRGDVTEELDRLESHLVAVEEALATRGPVGRELDFLLQEVGREVNTVGSKCADAKTVRSVVQLKSAVERLREQAANIE